MAYRWAFTLFLTISSLLAADDNKDSEAIKQLTKGKSAYDTRDYDGAIKASTSCIKLDPKNSLAYDLRGSCYFLKGKFKESVADFDEHLKLEPKKFNSHWRRGIALYYVGKYAEGMKQFEGYEKISTTDVENSVWHLMCAARKDNLQKARKSMLKVGQDGRVPMMVVFDLFKGTKKPEDVMKTALAGKKTEEQRKPDLFYAHLYLGLYHDLIGEKKKAIEHLKQASGKYKIGYMGEVARVHLEWLEQMK